MGHALIDALFSLSPRQLASWGRPIAPGCRAGLLYLLETGQSG